MRCQKCGTENNQNLVFCEKCLAPLKTTEVAIQQETKGMSGNSINTIYIIVVAVCMLLAMIFLPMFTSGAATVSLFGVNSRLPEINTLSDMAKEAAELPGITIDSTAATVLAGITIDSTAATVAMLPGILVLVSLVITILGGIMRKFSVQNFASVMTIVLVQIYFILCSIFIKMTPNVGYFLCTALSVSIIYLTQRVHDGINIFASVGLVISAIGAVIGLLGFNSKDSVQIIQDLIANNGSVPYTSNEIIGIIIIVVGMMFAIFAYEMEIYNDDKPVVKKPAYSR